MTCIRSGTVIFSADTLLAETIPEQDQILTVKCSSGAPPKAIKVKLMLQAI